MKKILLSLLLIMAVLLVNTQATKANATQEKPLRTVVLVADLQKAITDHIAKNYVDYTVKKATSVTQNKIVSYEVVIVKGTKPETQTTETLIYDENGKFVKKLPPTPKEE